MTAVGSCDHCRGRGEVPLLRTAVIDIGFVHANHVEAETAEVQRTHIGNAVIGAELLINRADDDAAVAVEQGLDVRESEDRVCNVGADHEVCCPEATLGQLAAHILHVGEERRTLFVSCVPLGADGVGVIARRVIKLHIQLFTFGLIVDVRLHRAGVVDHGLDGHPLFTTGDANVHIGKIVTLQAGGALGRGAVSIDGFAEAALAQIVLRQQTRRRDERGLVFVNLKAPAFHRNITGAGRHERRHLAVALAVLGQHLVGSEDVVIARREVTILEERLLGHDFLNNRHQDIGIKEVQFCTHS